MSRVQEVAKAAVVAVSAGFAVAALYFKFDPSLPVLVGAFVYAAATVYATWRYPNREKPAFDEGQFPDEVEG